MEAVVVIEMEEMMEMLEFMDPLGRWRRTSCSAAASMKVDWQTKVVVVVVAARSVGGVVFLSLLSCDILIYALTLSAVPIHPLPVRIAPYIRVIFVILSIRHFMMSDTDGDFMQVQNKSTKRSRYLMDPKDVLWSSLGDVGIE
ncbi:hypothetical protein QJS04_geneDACA020627 [Acorus gramineus]|uniref:Uncharacterized protein n=1 Tax=Acorus gramineus TaxID=55184 RepID=A0AAV9B874_ACOGR|nr:hypothetical protein QJS04_geneDACA020627 [Acorus gramineus]